MKLSKTQLYKIIQSGRFLGRLLGPVLKTGLPLMKNLLAKSVLIPKLLTAAVSAADARIHKKWNILMERGIKQGLKYGLNIAGEIIIRAAYWSKGSSKKKDF